MAVPPTDHTMATDMFAWVSIKRGSGKEEIGGTLVVASGGALRTSLLIM